MEEAGSEEEDLEEAGLEEGDLEEGGLEEEDLGVEGSAEVELEEEDSEGEDEAENWAGCGSCVQRRREDCGTRLRCVASMFPGCPRSRMRAFEPSKECRCRCDSVG